MGNTGWRLDDTKEVVLCLHSVHNVEHSPNESYYGMATDHGSEAEVPVTSERPAHLSAGLDSVISVRIFLHNRGSPSSSDRPVGQISIPVREMLDVCGPGLYQTWFLLEPAAPYGSMHRSQVVERFRRSLHGVSMELHTSRICLTLLESSSDPNEWMKEERDRTNYFGPLLVSHVQHMNASQAYFDHIERAELAAGERNARPATPVEPKHLHAELQRLQQQQRDEETGQLQHELDKITTEANKLIQKGNGTILKLKSDLRQLRDVEAVQLQREHSEVEHRLADLRREGVELRERINVRENAALDAELEQLRKDVLVLTNQKSALMTMVQEMYGNAHSTQPTQAQAAARAAFESIRGPGGAGGAAGGAAREPRAQGNLLPEAHEMFAARSP